jgi:hypothetical protein
MSNRRKHLYHLVNRSSRALSVSIAAFFIMNGFVFCLMNLKPLLFKGDLSLIGLIFLALM